MANDNKKKSLIKDIAIVLCVWIPLLFIIVGGIIWIDGGFYGTLMEQLFPAIFFGFSVLTKHNFRLFQRLRLA